MAKLIACAGQGVELSGVPTEIKILPLGRVHSQKGDFNVDDESFELIRKQFKDRKLDLVIDYEHQTLSDVQAPAGGWIKDLYKGEDAIIAKVEWTPKAAEYLKNKEYRYLSPVVLVRKRDQKATAIHSVALTNTPAIDGMFALVNSLDIEDISEGGNIMDLKELAKALGLPETATEEEIKKAVEDAAKAAEKLKEMDGKKPGEGDGKPGDGEPKPEGADMVANSTILSMLGLKADAKTEDVAASIMALKAGAPDTQAELLALKQRMAERDADEEVQKALKTGKITAAQSEWAKSYALKDMEGFKGFVDKAPVVVPQGKEIMIKDDMMKLDRVTIKASFVDCEPQDVIRYVLACAGIEDYVLSDEHYGKKDLFVIDRKSGINTIAEVNSSWGIKNPFFFQKKVFYWGTKEEQKEIYVLEEGETILSLNKYGDLWEAETIAIPWIHHSQEVEVQHSKYSGIVTVEKTIVRSDDTGAVHMYIYFAGGEKDV